jgi:hypothetical protein
MQDRAPARLCRDEDDGSEGEAANPAIAKPPPSRKNSRRPNNSLLLRSSLLRKGPEQRGFIVRVSEALCGSPPPHFNTVEASKNWLSDSSRLIDRRT